MNNISDFKNICRMCMLSCDIKFTQNIVILDVFYKLTDIHFETNDELPQQVCLKCFDKVNEIHEFAFKCKRTHVCLLKCLNDFKNAQINEEQETSDEINEPIKTVEEITIDEHEIDLVKDEVLNSASEYVIDELKLENGIDEDNNCELERYMIPETSDQNINCSEDDLLILNTPNIEVENDEESNDNVNLNGKHNGEQPYKCSKSFSNSDYLQKHMKTHSGECPNKCDKCLKSFTQSNDLKIHMRRHNGERPNKCKHCAKSFIRSSDLKNHMMRAHGKRLYKCEHCSKSFARSDEFKAHMRTHSGELSHKCDKCSKSFKQSYLLKIHMRTHSGERPYKCQQCSKSFSQSASLIMHRRTHTDERPYKCDACSISYTRSSTLNRHMRTHNGERPYKCGTCSKAYTRSTALNRHMRTHST